MLSHIKIFISICFCLFLFIGCKKSNKTSQFISNVKTKTLATKDHVIDTVKTERFNDFLPDFMLNRKFQYSRLAPNLREGWKYSKLLYQHETYITFFNSSEDQDLINSQDLKKVNIEFTEKPFEIKKVYSFQINRETGKWELIDVSNSLLSDQEQEFYSFFYKFLNDASYRLKHIQNPFSLLVHDPDSYESIEGFASPSQWNDFAPQIIQKIYSNINFMQTNGSQHNKVVMVSSVDGSMSSSLYFKKDGKKWILTRLENN